MHTAPKLRHPEIAASFRILQDRICQAMEKADGSGIFQEDVWQRKEGGGGRSRILKQGSIIEKGGVNFSEVFGALPDMMKKQALINADSISKSFYATGVSIVMHPLSPMIPIIHMNVRYFETDKGTSWFGGGIDLTPLFVNENDARFFHRQLKSCCDTFHNSWYGEFRKWADDYFFIPHRNETRGVGGIFFDHLEETPQTGFEVLWAFVQAVAELFIPVYTEIIRRNKDLSYGETEKKWQRIRRGRYAEFNLVYDRGTKFGLETGGRTESILMSLPPQADWLYNYIPEAGSTEAISNAWLRKGVDWIS